MTDNFREQHVAASGGGRPVNRRVRLLLVVALAAVVGMAFRVSWNALRDVASAIGADGVAATLYPFVVDGLMALALVATLVLTDRDRRFALRVLGFYTAASLVLNYVHGLIPGLHEMAAVRVRLSPNDVVHWALVLLASSLPVGAIFFGSDLVARVLHHRPESGVGNASTGPVPVPVETAGEPATVPAEPAASPQARNGPGAAVGTPRVRGAGTARKAAVKPAPGAARNTRPRKPDEAVLEELAALRIGAAAPLSLRSVCDQIGIGADRLKGLLSREGLSLDPLPEAPRPLHAVPDDSTETPRAAAN